MLSHRFSVGAKVRVVSTATSNTAEAFLNLIKQYDVATPTEVWEITRLFPVDGSAIRYRIRGRQDEPEQVVVESQLDRA